MKGRRELHLIVSVKRGYEVTIHSRSKHHAKNLPAKLSVAAKTAASVFLMMFRTAYTLISENTHPFTCKHDKAEYFLKPAVNSNDTKQSV